MGYVVSKRDKRVYISSIKGKKLLMIGLLNSMIADGFYFEKHFRWSRFLVSMTLNGCSWAVRFCTSQASKEKVVALDRVVFGGPQRWKHMGVV